VVERAEGSIIEDTDGNQYLDFTAGIAVASTGHCHPEIVEAIIRQVKKLIHMSGTDFYYPSEIRLAEVLTQITPGKGSKKVFFANSGTEATEAALKLARYHTRRPLFLSFYGSFHGRSMGALSLTASKSVHKKGFSPLVPGVTHVPYAYCYRCIYGLKPETCDFYCVTWIEEDLFRTTVPPEEVAAIFVEPIQGEGGYVVPPPGYLQRLQSLARKYGILLVADEIQTGVGRTGKMFACEYEGVVPEILTLAKGIASGLPLGAMVAATSVTTWERGSHANTFGGNPVACEAALTTLQLVRDGLMENAAVVGKYLLERLEEMKKTHRLMGDVRGRGLMIGVEFVQDRVRRQPAPVQRDRVIQECFNRGLLILGCGQSVIRFIPPLVITKDETDTALEIFQEAVQAAEALG
jgi:4-aminobutyrate aminotransferase